MESEKKNYELKINLSKQQWQSFIKKLKDYHIKPSEFIEEFIKDLVCDSKIDYSECECAAYGYLLFFKEKFKFYEINDYYNCESITRYFKNYEDAENYAKYYFNLRKDIPTHCAFISINEYDNEFDYLKRDL